MTPFWWSGWFAAHPKATSWILESASGIGLQVFLHLWGAHGFALTLLAGLVVSLGYEWALDRNGWSLEDVLQRALAQGLTELVWVLW